MKRRVVVVIVGAFSCIFLRTPAAIAQTTRPFDSTVGKPAAFNGEVIAIVGNPLSNSTQGKPPIEEILSTNPPRSTGPGFIFNPHQLFYVYSDAKSSVNHYAPSGWMGDYADIRFNDQVVSDPADGRTSMQIVYLAKGTNGANWAGIYWQYPINNWGNKRGGYNLQGMHRVTFWAKGETGHEVISVFKIGGIGVSYPDTGASQIGPVHLNKEWTQYAIDLDHVDLSKISGGFAWATGRDDNVGPITFYLDEIRYEK